MVKPYHYAVCGLYMLGSFVNMKITKVMNGMVIGLECTNSWSRGTTANWIKKSKTRDPIKIYCFILAESS